VDFCLVSCLELGREERKAHDVKCAVGDVSEYSCKETLERYYFGGLGAFYRMMLFVKTPLG
jgi:hypothetical protein